MLEYLKALAARFTRRDFGPLPPDAPGDPYADVREPRRGGPGGRSTAIAVAEPEEADGRERD
jgi:hypothetical protein